MAFQNRRIAQDQEYQLPSRLRPGWHVIRGSRARTQGLGRRRSGRQIRAAEPEVSGVQWQAAGDAEVQGGGGADAAATDGEGGADIIDC